QTPIGSGTCGSALSVAPTGRARLKRTRSLLILFFILFTSLSVLGSEKGKWIYETNCATCHGRDGAGNGPSAYPLDPKPLDFTPPIFKFRSTPSKTLPTDEDLLRTIRAGLPGTRMPGWAGLLTEEQMLDVVAYLKTFSARFEKEKPGVSIVIPQETPD